MLWRIGGKAWGGVCLAEGRSSGEESWGGLVWAGAASSNISRARSSGSRSRTVVCRPATVVYVHVSHPIVITALPLPALHSH
jgi:hypothetical protein